MDDDIKNERKNKDGKLTIRKPWENNSIKDKLNKIRF